MSKTSKIKVIWQKNKYKKVTIIICGAIAIFGLGYLGWKILNSPSHGIIKTNTTSPEARQQLPDYVNLDSDEFMLTYSEKFIAVPTTLGAGEEVHFAYAVKTDDPSIKPNEFLDIVLRVAQPGGITLDREYQKYFSDTKNYKFTNKYYQGEAIDFAMKQTGGTDQIGLWLHGNHILSVHIKKDRSQAGLDSELKDIMTSVQWRSQ